MSNNLRVLVVDNDHIIRAALIHYLHSHPSIDVVDSADNGNAAVEKVRRQEPDVILLNPFLPGKNGIDVTREITDKYPDARVLILADALQPDCISVAVEAGVLGVVPTSAEPQDLFRAIRRISKGKEYIHPELSLPPAQDRDASSMPVLTDRENEVLNLVAQGLSNRTIAGRLHLSPRTVGNHIGSILNKLHLNNRTQAVIYALKRGLVCISLTVFLLDYFTLWPF